MECTNCKTPNKCVRSIISQQEIIIAKSCNTCTHWTGNNPVCGKCINGDVCMWEPKTKAIDK